MDLVNGLGLKLHSILSPTDKLADVPPILGFRWLNTCAGSSKKTWVLREREST
jgi:hypothetical protein